MSIIPEAPGPNGPDFTTRPHTWFAYVIDGEVAWIHVLPNEVEQFHAVLSSDPKVVAIPSNMTDSVVPGWNYDGVNFVQP
jgi:hypothetical protein